MTDGSVEDRSMAAERRHVTALFADMVGFTAFTDRMGEEAAYALMRILHGLMADAVRRQGGTVKEFTGDGIIALFGAPARSENTALSACRAAIDIHQRLAERAADLGAAHGLHPRLRIGIAAGPVIVVGPTDAGDGTAIAAFGDTLNLASHLQALAEPGGVLLSESAWMLVQGLVDASFGGLHEIKGKAAPQHVYRLDAIRQRAPRFERALSRGLSTHIGGAREIEALDRCLDDPIAGVRVIDIIGDPGMGKSRLIHEFRARLDGRVPLILTGHCFEGTEHAPLLPLLEVTRYAFGIGSLGDVAAHRPMPLTSIGCDAVHSLALFRRLFGPKAGADSPRNIDGASLQILLEELLRVLFRATPALLILEDLQWIDGASEDVLQRIIRSEQSLHLVVLQARRPEYRPPWIDHKETATLKLQPLSTSESLRIVEERLGAHALPKTLVRLIVERAEGNPLFIEELAGFLLERTKARPSDRLDEDVQAVATALPTSLQSLFAARIDRLPPDDRALLRTASAIGRRFGSDMLAAVASEARDVDARLAALAASGLIRPEGAPGEFAFTHALMRDTLYESLLRGPRSMLRLKIAQELERRGDNRTTAAAIDTLPHDDGSTETSDPAGSYPAAAANSSRHFAGEARTGIFRGL